MIIGPPSDEQRRLFDHVVAAQQVAFAVLRPGVTAADVDGAVCATSRTTTCFRTGGSTRGTRSGCATTRRRFSTSATTHRIEAGMVFTIEPGLYDDQLGGFRHSDTVLVVEDGIELLTSYPSDLESLTLPA